MAAGLLGKKVGMTRVFIENGEQVPVSVVIAGPCIVIGKRTMEQDKYTAIRVGLGERKEKHTSKPLAGEAKKNGVKAAKVIREFRVTPEELATYEIGQTLTVDKLFTKGQLIDVMGISRGKGFQGVMKRHNMAGFVEAHGSHEYYRHAGAIGQRKTPGRVFKNKRMPGHMGLDRVTIQGLKIVDIDVENNLVLVSGSIPGHPTTLVTITPTVKAGKVKKVQNAAIAAKAEKTAKPKK
jgi:large subunit ribosomal protein L3